MPLHAQILCIGGNVLFALLFLIAAQLSLAEGSYGLATFLAFLAVAAGYSSWVLLKFRRYLSAEATLERELHIEQLREELEALRSNNRNA